MRLGYKAGSEGTQERGSGTAQGASGSWYLGTTAEEGRAGGR